MLWILQQNFYSEPNYEKLVETLPRMGLPTLRVKPVPFTHQLLPYDYDTSKASDLSQVPEPEIDSSQGAVVCGSYTLAKIAKDRGWTPGALIEDSGATEFGGVPTNTVAAVGPASNEALKPITGHLKLL